jgi:hypothetical protein
MVSVQGIYDSTDPNFGTTIRAPIRVDFIPDLIVLKDASLLVDPQMSSDSYRIISSLVPYNLMAFSITKNKIDVAGVATDIETFIPFKCNYHFINKSKNPINGNYSFQIIPFNPISTIVGLISLNFEFIKF